MDLGKVSQQNNVAPEKTQKPAGNIERITSSVSTAFKSADSYVNKQVQKINENGNNPFGSKSDIDANKKLTGFVEKQAMSAFIKLDINNDGFFDKKRTGCFCKC